jgi:hypothetical protein
VALIVANKKGTNASQSFLLSDAQTQKANITPPQKNGNDCQPCASATAPAQYTFFSIFLDRAITFVQLYNYNFTITILKCNFKKANFQASLNHRANACSCFFFNVFK